MQHTVSETNASYWTNDDNRYHTVIELVGKDRVLPKYCCLCGAKLRTAFECEDAYLFCSNGIDP